MSKKNSITERFLKIYSFLRFNIPYHLTRIILYGLALTVVYNKQESLMISTLFIVIAITIALAQTFFQYASILKNNKYRIKIIKAGEYMLISSLYLIIITILIFFSWNIDKLILIKVAHPYIVAVNFIIQIFAFTLFTYVADFISKSIHAISYYLFWRVDI